MTAKTDYFRDYDAMRRAAAVSQWYLGDASWANRILAAYFDPDDADAAEAIAELEGDRAP